MNHILLNWKSSLAGVLSFLIMALTTIVGFMGASDVGGGGGLHTSTKVLAYCNLALALCRGAVGLIQTDAGTVAAVVPGQGIQAVPSHETPDSPVAKAVVKGK